MNDRTMIVPPSQQGAQGPVLKPGEPLNPVKGIMAEPHQVAGEPLEPERKPPPVVVAPKVEKPDLKKVEERTISPTIRRHK